MCTDFLTFVKKLFFAPDIMVLVVLQIPI
uniref:Uncharacterized protein n=1 Tax=Anguilla anguilla TaxID=7936 RepID=A0A0E9PC45_ANGAN